MKHPADFYLNFYSEFMITEATWVDMFDFYDFILLVFGNTTWTPSQLWVWMEANDSVVYLLWHRDRLVGSIMVTQYFGWYHPYRYITFVGIHPEYRNKGLGYFLLLLVIYGNSGIWYLETDDTNIAARRLYESLGFLTYEPLGIETNDPRPGKIHYRLQLP